MEMARCMLNGKNLPHKFWLEAIMCASYVLNICSTKAIKNIAPYDAWIGHKPNVGHMRIFGSLAYAFVPPEQRHKLQDKAKKCIFVGYNKESKGYQLFQPNTGKIIISQDVISAENATQPLMDCSSEPVLDQPNAFDTLLPLLQNVMFEGD